MQPKRAGEPRDEREVLENELRAIEERAEACRRTAVFHYAAHEVLLREATRLRTVLAELRRDETRRRMTDTSQTTASRQAS